MIIKTSDLLAEINASDQQVIKALASIDSAIKAHDSLIERMNQLTAEMRSVVATLEG